MLIGAIYTILLLAVDLISKHFIFDFLSDIPGRSFVVIEDIFSLTYAKNEGAAFSIFSSNQGFLIAFNIILLVAMSVFLFINKSKNKLLKYSVLTIFAGGLANIADRLAFGYVRDFIEYTFLDTFFGINFAIGNVADIFLLVGVLMLLTYVAFEHREGDIFGKIRRKK